VLTPVRLCDDPDEDVPDVGTISSGVEPLPPELEICVSERIRENYKK